MGVVKRICLRETIVKRAMERKYSSEREDSNSLAGK